MKRGRSMNKQWTNKDVNKERRSNDSFENKNKINKTENTSEEPFFGDWSYNSKIVISVDSEDESVFSSNSSEETIEKEKEILNESFDFGELQESEKPTEEENEQEMDPQQEFIDTIEKEDHYVLYLTFKTREEAEECQMNYKHLTDASTIFETQ
jgi:hypothetical protein